MTVDTIERLVQQIRDDREHGASELARLCLLRLAEYARTADTQDAGDLRNRLFELAHRLQQSRSTMAPITNLINRWLEVLQAVSDSKSNDFRNRAVAQAEALIEQSRKAVAKAARHAADLIGPGKTVMTHSLSSTVVNVFELLGSRAMAIITESRPPGEGRLLAEKLSSLGIATDFISDQQMGLFVQHADVALVGADTVAGDGSVINKAGTYLLALAAYDRGRPFYVCCESFKYSELDASAILLESHDAAEIDPPALPKITSHNVYFDVTPAHLVTSWITEVGVADKWKPDPTA